MSIAHSQLRTFLRLYRSLESHLRRDPGLPARIESVLRRERGIGSRDRRLYRELLYTAVRHLPWIEGIDDDRLAGIVAALAAGTPSSAAFKATFAQPSLVVGLDRSLLLPGWFRDECPRAFEPPLADVLQTRPPLWLRVRSGAQARVLGEFERLGWDCRVSEVLDGVLRVDSQVDVTRTQSYLSGLMEVQDLGSQMILAALGLGSGGRWLDACAGAGGKTLQLGDLLGNDGTIDASDVRSDALAELVLRARRAGFGVEGPGLEPPDPEEEEGRSAGARISLGAMGSGYDGVLVDAPCSGSGTWRRAPHLKWTSTPAWIRRCAQRQAALLGEYAERVRPGGLLVYATCSLCRSENEGVAEAFLAERTEFKPLPLARTFGFETGPGWMTLDPARHDSDGYFVAQFVRSPA